MDCFLLPALPRCPVSLGALGSGLPSASLPAWRHGRELQQHRLPSSKRPPGAGSQTWASHQLPGLLDGGAELGSVGRTAKAPGGTARCHWGFATSASQSCPPKHREKQAVLQAGGVLGPLSFKGAVELLGGCMSWERFIPACLLLTSVSVRLLPGRKEGIPGWWSVL